jgi:hypothetical protein
MHVKEAVTKSQRQKTNCELQERQIKSKERNDLISRPLNSTVYNADIARVIHTYT